MVFEREVIPYESCSYACIKTKPVPLVGYWLLQGSAELDVFHGQWGSSKVTHAMVADVQKWCARRKRLHCKRRLHGEDWLHDHSMQNHPFVYVAFIINARNFH